MTILFLATMLSSGSLLGQMQAISMKLLPGEEITAERISRVLQTGDQISWHPIRTEVGLDGSEHTRFQQFFMNIPVEDAMVIVHTKDQQNTITGYMVSANQFSASRLSFTNETENDNPGAKRSLVWIETDKGFEPAFRSVLFSEADFADLTVFRSPDNNEILRQSLHKCHLDSTGTAQTNFHGTCQINTSHQQGHYLLQSAGRGNGIVTFNLNHQLNYNTVSDITDDDNFWDLSNLPYGTDAHFCAEQYYDFLQGNFQRNSLDHSGFVLTSYLNYGQNLANAFWNGQAVVYGSGNTSSPPLTVIDVAGHEFTHGLIQKTAGLHYSNEPGIINEAISDIFGLALDHYTFPASQNWTIGERSGQTLRSFTDPQAYSQPEEYQGPGWYYGTGDNGGVHINSGFINHWFYLLAEGGSGINSKGWNYHLTGIGLTAALRIVYQSLVGYLLPSSGFDDFYLATLEAATDLYGHCSPQYLAVCEAWKAVGLKNHQIQVPFIESSASSICQGQITTLNAQGWPGSDFYWFRNGQSLPFTGSSISVHDSGSYHITESRCGTPLASEPFLVTVHPLPVVTSTDVSGCPGVPVMLSGSPSGGTFSLPNPYSGPALPYTYTYTDSMGCTASAIAAVNRFVTHTPGLTFSKNPVPLNDHPVILHSDSGTFFYGSGVTGNQFHPMQTGVTGPHEVSVACTDLNGCYLTNSATITVLPPCRQITEPPIIAVQQMNSSHEEWINLKAMNAEDFEIKWTISGSYFTTDPLNVKELNLIVISGNLDVKLHYENTCNDSAFVTERIELKKSANLITYPNPVKENLTVKGKEILSCVIRDSKGKLLIRESYPGGRSQITVQTSGFSSGLYFLTVMESGTETTTCFMVE